MAKTTDVELPADVVLKWPPQCIQCGQDDPQDQLKIKDRFLWPPWRAHSVEIPCCSGCNRSAKRQLRWRTPSIWLAAILLFLLFFFFVPSISDLGPGVRKLVPLGLLFFVFAIFSRLSPLLVEVSAFRKKILYEFKDKTYAQEFAKINNTSVDLD